MSDMTVTADGGSRPDPDPTRLTMLAMERELRGLREILETRMSGQDKLIEMIHASMRTRSHDITAEVQHSQNLILETFKIVEEKFESVQKQFVERDKRADQTATDIKAAAATASQAAKEAVAAALQAAKELGSEQAKASAASIAKTETSTNKQIEQIGALIIAVKQASDDKYNDLKDRVTASTGHKTGESDNKGEERAARAEMRSFVSMLIAAAVAISAFVGFLYHNNSTIPPVTPPAVNNYYQMPTPIPPPIPK